MEAEAARRILIVAGEASGDRHAARLVQALRALGNVRTRGVVGPALEAQGVEPIARAEVLSIVGFTGVLARLPRILELRRRLFADVERFRPEVAILVDSPGFNFRIGPELHRRGVRVFYYIAPQVWAWHAERARQMRTWVDRLAVVFPFEEELFRRAGVDAHFVGHPLAEDEGQETTVEGLRAALGFPGARRIVGLLPGSRPGELRAHLRVMIEAGLSLCAGRPDLVVAVGVAPGLERAARAALPGDHVPVRALTGITRALEAHATCCVVASGTATLETAWFGTPHAIVYRTGWLNYAIARRVVRLERIGLPNIVAGEEVAPELLQDACTAPAIARTLERWLDDPVAAAAQRARLALVRARLGGPGAARRAAELAWDLLP